MPQSWLDIGFAAIDCETTNRNVNWAYICEIAGVAIRAGAVDTAHRFETLVNPEKSIEAGATAAHGITNAMRHSAPVFRETRQAFESFVGNQVIVLHNARYYMRCLRRVLPGYKFPIVLDTKEFARAVGVKGYRGLWSLVQNYEVEARLIHLSGGRRQVPYTALYDAAAIAHLFVALVEKHFPGGITLYQLDEMCGWKE